MWIKRYVDPVGVVHIAARAKPTATRWALCEFTPSGFREAHYDNDSLHAVHENTVATCMWCLVAPGGY